MTNIKSIIILFYIPIIFMNCDTKKYNVKVSNKEELSKTQEREKLKHNLSLDNVSDIKDSIKSKKQETIYDFTCYLPTELEEWYSKNYKKGESSKKWVIGEIYSHPTSKSIKIC